MLQVIVQYTFDRQIVHRIMIRYPISDIVVIWTALDNVAWCFITLLKTNAQPEKPVLHPISR